MMGACNVCGDAMFIGIMDTVLVVAGVCCRMVSIKDAAVLPSDNCAVEVVWYGPAFTTGAYCVVAICRSMCSDGLVAENPILMLRPCMSGVFKHESHPAPFG